LLEDEKWVNEFLETSREKLRDSYLFTTAWLRKEGISYFADGNSGFYLWLDLAPFLPKLPLSSSSGILQEGSDAPVEGVKALNVTEGSKEEAEKKGKQEKDDEGWQREALMVKKLMDEKVILAIGKEFHAPRPGSFRIIFAKPRDELVEGLQRIKRAIG
jgi:1-aminocyclopropane-1-carboxylate synthase